MRSSPQTDELISELVDAIDSLKNHVIQTGRDNSPAWIGLNFKVQTIIQKARPHVANHVLRQIDSSLCDLNLGDKP